MALEAGRLRHFVELQYQQHSQDQDTGELLVQWVTGAAAWAEIAPLSAREFVESNAKQSRVTARITIRYRPDIDATWRVVHRGKTYNIEGVLPDKDSGIEYMTLPVSEGVSEGA